MADHTVTLSVAGRKVVCAPAELHVRRGHTVSFGPIPHKGTFRGRLRQNVRAAAQGAPYAEHELKDENLEMGVIPTAVPTCDGNQPRTIRTEGSHPAVLIPMAAMPPKAR
jgi:hypothetical protein